MAVSNATMGKFDVDKFMTSCDSRTLVVRPGRRTRLLLGLLRALPLLDAPPLLFQYPHGNAQMLTELRRYAIELKEVPSVEAMERMLLPLTACHTVVILSYSPIELGQKADEAFGRLCQIAMHLRETNNRCVLSIESWPQSEALAALSSLEPTFVLDEQEGPEILEAIWGPRAPGVSQALQASHANFSCLDLPNRGGEPQWWMPPPMTNPFTLAPASIESAAADY